MTVMLFLYPRPPPPAPLVPPPAPTATTDTEVTPAGATQEYVPAVVYACWPITAGVALLLAALAGPLP
jgi:hypothetical protein